MKIVVNKPCRLSLKTSHSLLKRFWCVMRIWWKSEKRKSFCFYISKSWGESLCNVLCMYVYTSSSLYSTSLEKIRMEMFLPICMCSLPLPFWALTTEINYRRNQMWIHFPRFCISSKQFMNSAGCYLLEVYPFEFSHKLWKKGIVLRDLR